MKARREEEELGARTRSNRRRYEETKTRKSSQEDGLKKRKTNTMQS